MDDKQNDERARQVLDPTLKAAIALDDLKTSGKVPLDDIAKELRRQCQLVNDGDLSRPEDLMTAQAHVLDAAFTSLLNRGLTNQNPVHAEAFLKLAFRAQSQCRSAVQTLAELKMPRQVAFIRQANVADQQVVMNGSSRPDPACTRAEKTGAHQPDELMEIEHGERLDTRATGTAVGADSAMATVGSEYRPEERRGQGHRIP